MNTNDKAMDFMFVVLMAVALFIVGYKCNKKPESSRPSVYNEKIVKQKEDAENILVQKRDDDRNRDGVIEQGLKETDEIESQMSHAVKEEKKVLRQKLKEHDLKLLNEIRENL